MILLILTTSHISVERVGRMYFLNLGVKGLVDNPVFCQLLFRAGFALGRSWSWRMTADLVTCVFALQESDEEANGDTSDGSSTTGGRDSVQPDNADASSVCSNSSNNDDALSNRSSSPAGARPEGPVADTLPAKMKRVLIEEGRSCARTDAVFIGARRPRPKSPCAASSSDSGVAKETHDKAEVSGGRPGCLALAVLTGFVASAKLPDDRGSNISSYDWIVLLVVSVLASRFGTGLHAQMFNKIQSNLAISRSHGT